MHERTRTCCTESRTHTHMINGRRRTPFCLWHGNVIVLYSRTLAHLRQRQMHADHDAGGFFVPRTLTSNLSARPVETTETTDTRDHRPADLVDWFMQWWRINYTLHITLCTVREKRDTCLWVSVIDYLREMRAQSAIKYTIYAFVFVTSPTDIYYSKQYCQTRLCAPCGTRISTCTTAPKTSPGAMPFHRDSFHHASTRAQCAHGNVTTVAHGRQLTNARRTRGRQTVRVVVRISVWANWAKMLCF